MLLHRGDRHFRQHECGAPHFVRTRATESVLRKARQAFLEARRLIARAAAQCRRPFALDEVVSAMEQQYPRVVEV